MIRRNNIINVGGFDPEFRRVEDIDLAIRLAFDGHHFVGSKEYLFTREMTDAEDKSSIINLKFEQRLAKKYRGFLEKHGLFYHAYNWPLLRHHHFEKQYTLFLCVFLLLFIKNPIFTIDHLFKSGPKRLMHERKIKFV